VKDASREPYCLIAGRNISHFSTSGTAFNEYARRTKAMAVAAAIASYSATSNARAGSREAGRGSRGGARSPAWTALVPGVTTIAKSPTLSLSLGMPTSGDGGWIGTNSLSLIFP